jgi:ABC-type multidrug transport system fused ATPase/permease subunit
LGAALVLDEFALILHLRDVYWTSDGRLSVDAVFVALGVTVLLLLGISPNIVPGPGQHGDTWEAIVSLSISLLVTFSLAAITLLKGKIWTGLFGLFLFPLLIVGSIRLARPGSPWARWRYQRRPHKRARAARRERRVRQPVMRFTSRVEDFLSGLRPDSAPDAEPDPHKAAVGRQPDDG